MSVYLQTFFQFTCSGGRRLLRPCNATFRLERKARSPRTLLTDSTRTLFSWRLSAFPETQSRTNVPWLPTTPLKLEDAISVRNFPPNRFSWSRWGEERDRARRAPPTVRKRPSTTSTSWDRKGGNSTSNGRRSLRVWTRELQEVWLLSVMEVWRGTATEPESKWKSAWWRMEGQLSGPSSVRLEEHQRNKLGESPYLMNMTKIIPAPGLGHSLQSGSPCCRVPESSCPVWSTHQHCPPCWHCLVVKAPPGSQEGM